MKGDNETTMVYITFAQPKLKQTWDDRIRRIFDVVKTRATPDLWIKVLVYTSSRLYWRGNYRWTEAHGFYPEEWKFIRKHPKIKHCITLKIGHDCTDKDVADLIAHEFRHYLQYKKYGNKMIARRNNGRRAVQVERDAKDWSKERVNQLIAEHKLKYKQDKDGFELGYWMFRQEFAKMFD